MVKKVSCFMVKYPDHGVCTILYATHVFTTRASGLGIKSNTYQSAFVVYVLGRIEKLILCIELSSVSFGCHSRARYILEGRTYMFLAALNNPFACIVEKLFHIKYQGGTDYVISLDMSSVLFQLKRTIFKRRDPLVCT